VLQEPSKNDVMNEGIMKELTGGDPITARGLYMDPITFKPMFSLIVCANLYIHITSDDDGTWRRIKPVEFCSKFKDADQNPDPDNFEFLKDKNLKNKLPVWAGYLLYKLSLIAFKNDGIVDDNEMIIQANKRYRKSQNKPQQFIDEMIIPNESGKISKKYLGDSFKNWMELKYKFAIKNKELFDILDLKYDSNSTYYVGFDLKEQNSPDSDTIVTKEDKFIQAFLNKYTITKENKDRIARSSIQEWAKNEGLDVNTSKKINPILIDKFKLNEIKTSGLYYWCGLKTNE
jgi:phage/plasmid-associated DNA primase